MPENVTIDLQAIENLRSLNPDDGDGFLREVVDIFIEDTPRRIAELDQSLAAGDVATFTRAAHSIKGSSANLGAASLRMAAEHLENLGRGAGLAGATPLLAQLKAEFARTQSELGRLLQKK